jgi:hypothetical protein
METTIRKRIQAQVIQAMSPQQLQEAQKHGLLDDGTLGDLDTSSGFGVGEAPPGAKPATQRKGPKVKAGKKAKEDRASPQDVSHDTAAGTVTPAAVAETVDDAMDMAGPSAPM